jgi:hypothetical protein
MELARTLLIALLLVPALPAQAAEEDLPAFGHALTLVHLFVRIAAESETPQQSLKAIDDVLLGRNPAANEAVAGLLGEALADVPREHRSTIAAIGRDLASLARKNLRKSGAAESSLLINPLQARKDLNAMGLSYYDSKQFLDAVKRNDVLAVELYIAGRGVDLASRDFWGRDALELARANGNTRIAELLARNLPAAR